LLPSKVCGSLKSAGKVITRLVKRSVLLSFAAAVMAFGQQVSAQGTGPMQQLNVQDLRLAQVGERLLEANGALCRSEMPLTGMVLHSRDQYSDRVAGDAFANGPVAVAVVVPGSPAEAAGIQVGDGLAAVGPRQVSEM